MIRSYRERYAQFYRITVVMLIVLLIVEMSVIFIIRAGQQSELNNRLYETGKLNTAAVNLKLQSYIDNLKAVALGIGMNMKEQKGETILKQSQINTSNKYFMRLYLIYPNGQGVGTDYEDVHSEWSDYSQQEYFIRAIRGEEVIMAPFIDNQTKEQVVLFSVPVYSQEKVSGVICGMVELETFHELIESAVFGGAGYSCIITSGGGIIVQPEKGQNSKAIDAICKADKQKDIIAHIRRDMEDSRSGILHISHNGLQQVRAVYMPANVNGWYVLTTVPYSVLSSSGIKVMVGMVCLTSIIMLIYLLLLFMAVRNDRRQKQKTTVLLEEPAMAQEGVTAMEVPYHTPVTDKGLEKALAEEEFLVFLQPKYSVMGEQAVLSGAEALVRWKSKDNGFIYPDAFIPVFENNGFIRELDLYMLEQVCRLQRKWLDAGYECVPVSVNQSRLHLKEAGYAASVKEIVDRYHIPYQLIELEITENAVIEDRQAVIKTFRDLHDIGFVTAMDDFGSGYSSLSMLKDIELDVIKVDKEFFGETLQNNRGRNVVASILKMLRELQINVVAEGIESAEQVEFLKLCGCDIIQGYFFGKPSPVEEFESAHLYIKKNQ